MYSEISANKRKTWLIMFVFVVFVGLLGWFVSEFFLGQPSFTIVIVIGALVYAAIMYFGAAKLATSVNGAREVTLQDEPRLYRIVENLSITTGMPMPKVYVMEEPGLNAFATGRDPQHAIVAATRGLIDAMSDTELEGVMAHEIGHVKNYDIRVSMIAMGLALAVSLIADIALRSMWFGGGRRNNDEQNNGGNMLFFIVGIIGLILAPLVAKLIQLAVTRRREYLADATGALTTRYPEGLASALEKIAAYGSVTRNQNSATAHLFIANPLNAKSVSKLFSTHPPVEDRIARLREMGDKL